MDDVKAHLCDLMRSFKDMKVKELDECIKRFIKTFELEVKK